MPFVLGVIALVLAAALVPTAPPAVVEAAPAPPAVPGILVVGLRAGGGLDDDDRPVPRLATARLLAPAGGEIVALGDGAYRLALPAGGDPAVAAAALANRPGVRYAEPEYLLRAFQAVPGFEGTPNDPAWRRQEEMRRIEADRAWTITTGSPEVIIAVLDSGVQATHVDLAGKLLPGYDFIANRPGAVDDQGHGTFTAALAAGTGDNGAGIAGVCWGCRILPLKILDSRGYGPTTAFSRALRYAVEHGARIVNVSAGVVGYSALMRDAVEYAIANDVLIVAAAGNEGNDRIVYPAAFDRVLAVAAVDDADQAATFSSFGYFVDLTAPGVAIVSAGLGRDDAVVSRNGTSAAAPLVAGAAGLLLSLHPDLSADALTSLLTDLSLDLAPAGRDDRHGAGRLSVYDALLAAARPPAGAGLSAQVRDGGGPYALRVGAGGFAPAEPVRAWAALADGRFLVRRGLSGDIRGAVEMRLTLTCDVPAGPITITFFGDTSRRGVIARVEVESPPASLCFAPLPTAVAAPDRRVFPQTGHTLAGGFRTFWEQNGDVGIFGYPISEEFREVNQTDGHAYTVQYFERARFEYHPEHRGTPHEVQLGLLGRLLAADRRGPSVPAAGPRRLFPATGYALGGDFLAYWEAHGGLEVFGYPISEPFQESGRSVQYLERNRFEAHPTAGPAHRVQLGLLGRELARRNRYLP